MILLLRTVKVASTLFQMPYPGVTLSAFLSLKVPMRQPMIYLRAIYQQWLAL